MPDPGGNLPGFEHGKLLVGAGDHEAAAARATSSDGVLLHYVTGGRGPALLLLHGWPETWYAWRHMMPALAEHYTVVAPDLRGLGDSSRPATGYDMNTVAADVAELTAALGHSELLVVGHDWGGAVAYSLAAQYRHRVKGLAVLDMLIPGFGWEAMMEPRAGGWLWHMAFHAVPDIPEALIAGKERMYLTHFLRGFGSVNPFAIDQVTVDEYLRCYTNPGGLHAALQYYQAWFTDIEQNRCHAEEPLEMPVLALGGENASGAFVRVSLEQVAADVTGDVLPSCGHWLPEEKPEETTARLLEFFGAEHRALTATAAEEHRGR